MSLQGTVRRLMTIFLSICRYIFVFFLKKHVTSEDPHIFLYYIRFLEQTQSLFEPKSLGDLA